MSEALPFPDNCYYIIHMGWVTYNSLYSLGF